MRRISVFAALVMVLATAAVVAKPATVTAATLSVWMSNITNGQTMSRPIYAVGPCTTGIMFTEGRGASLAVEMMAEGGITSPLVLWLRSKGWKVAVGPAPIYIGNTQLVSLPTPTLTATQSLCMAVISMIVPTNDGLVALNIPVVGNTNKWLYLPAYDAGTECNTERCTEMPAGGGACAVMGQGYNPLRCSHESIVSFHPGLHGIGEEGKPGELKPKVNGFNSERAGKLFFRLQ